MKPERAGGIRREKDTRRSRPVDKIVSVPHGAISGEIGHCDAGELDVVNDGLRRWLELARAGAPPGQ